MRKIILILFAFTYFISFGQANNDSSITKILSKKKYEKLFPHHDSIYSYKNFIEACQSFLQFGNEGDLNTRKKELIAFFANVAHETSGGWAQAKGGEYAWGLYFTEEQACKDGHCTIYNTAGSSKYQPVEGKSYYGRGAIQLSYAYNYGLAGDELNLPLLKEPELVNKDGVIAFKTALWFWMRSQKPKPSCHDVMCGNWKPSEDDIKSNRNPGFGMIINIINGGVECNSEDSTILSKKEERIGYYKWFAKIMNVEIENDCDCKGMATYGN